MENSKSELIAWINDLLKGTLQPITKIEQLGNGVAYCKLLSLIDPNSLNPAKIVVKPKTQIDHISNMKLFQNALQKLHLKKNFDIDKVTKCFFHENYDLALFLKKQYTLRFQGQNKENNTLNSSFEKVLNLSVVPERPSEEQIKIEQITTIILTHGTSDNKIIQICEVLGIQLQPPPPPPSLAQFENQSIFQTDSKRKELMMQQEKKTSMLCETPRGGEEMLLDPIEKLFSSSSHQQQEQKQSSSKLIMKIQSENQEKKETPNFFTSPVAQEQRQSFADFIKSESKQQQQYMQQYSIQKQLSMQNQLQSGYQSPFRDIVQQNPFPQSYRRDVFYSSKDIVEE